MDIVSHKNYQRRDDQNHAELFDDQVMVKKGVSGLWM
jgi:hypothetical protein